MQSLLALCGLATIPSASSLRCLAKDCIYYPDEDPYCSGSGVVECLEEDDDRCGSLDVTLGSGTSFTKWNCTRSTHDDCNQQVICNRMTKFAVDIEDTLDSCSVTCCDGDECNVSGKKDEVVAVLDFTRSSRI